jgi:hypothetical protein
LEESLGYNSAVNSLLTMLKALGSIPGTARKKKKKEQDLATHCFSQITNCNLNQEQSRVLGHLDAADLER